MIVVRATRRRGTRSGLTARSRRADLRGVLGRGRPVRGLPGVLLRGVRAGLPQADAEAAKRKALSRQGAQGPGQHPLADLLPLLLPHLLERPQGHRGLPGLLVDGTGRLGNPEHRLEEEVGEDPKARNGSSGSRRTTWRIVRAEAGDGVGVWRPSSPGRSFLRGPSRSGAGDPPVVPVRRTSTLDERPQVGRVNFFHPDYEYINDCAYFDYQRERVYVRTSRTLRKNQGTADEARSRQTAQGVETRQYYRWPPMPRLRR